MAWTNIETECFFHLFGFFVDFLALEVNFAAFFVYKMGQDTLNVFKKLRFWKQKNAQNHLINTQCGPKETVTQETTS